MNSVSNPAVNAAHHAKKHAKSAFSSLPAGDGGEFGDLFANMQAGTEGQDLAALAGKASPPVEGLASQVLGPTVHIITSETPAMSDDSLYAFARSQGMDESALALIFQRTAHQLPTADAAPTTSSPDTPLTLAGLSNGASDALLMAQKLNLQNAQAAEAKAAEAKAAENAVPDPVPAQPVTDADGMSALDLGTDAKIRWSVGQPGQLQGDAKADAKAEAKTAADQAAAMAAAQHDKREAPSRDFAASLVLGEAETAQFTKRVETKQASLRAERLGSISSNAFKSSALGSGLTAEMNDRDEPAPLESLDIGTELTGEDLHLIWAHRQASAEQAGGDGSQGAGQAAGQQTDIDLRAEQYEKLTQRLSEALGQRLAAQIARGDWKVELALKPQDLGNIEIKLNMKQGTLEASFDASETMTRSLIIDGMQQLKDNLAQAGMEVAQVNVNVRQDSQNGGNPTPGRHKAPAGISGVSKGSLAKTSMPADSAAPRQSAASNDGLDVLV